MPTNTPRQYAIYAAALFAITLVTGVLLPNTAEAATASEDAVEEQLNKAIALALVLERYQRLAEQGQADAQRILGSAYYEGVGVPQDYAEAVKWYRKAAEQGHVDAQHNLGVMYTAGQGAPQDFVLAYMWANLAAASGNHKAVIVRDVVASKLTPSQLAEAQKMSRNWKPKP